MQTIISKSEAISMIEKTVKGTMALTIDLSSPQDKTMRKTGNPYIGKGMVKLVTMNGMIGFDYNGGVNRLATKEGKDERDAKPRAWGVLSDNRLWVSHKGKTYLQMQVRSSSTPVYVIGDTVIPTESVKPFLPEKSKSSTQADLDGELIVRDVDMDNVLGMRFNGADYRLVADAPNVTQETLPAATPIVNPSPVANPA